MVMSVWALLNNAEILHQTQVLSFHTMAYCKISQGLSLVSDSVNGQRVTWEIQDGNHYVSTQR